MGLALDLRDRMQRNRVGRVLYRLYWNLDHHNAVLSASGMAFDTFMSLVPLVAFAGLVLSWLHQRGDLMLAPLARAAPAPVTALVDGEYLRLSDGGIAAIAPISLVAFIWVTSSGLSTALGVFEVMFETTPRPWYIRRMIAMACVLGSIAAVGSLAFASYGLASIVGDTFGKVLVVVAPGLILVGLLAGFFRIAIPRSRPMRSVAIAVVTTLVLWSIVSAAFSYYVATLARYATLYGSLATVAIFLFWLWLLALMLIIGGEVTAQLEGIRPEGAPSSRLIGRASHVPSEPPISQILKGG
jgi:membrane protein